MILYNEDTNTNINNNHNEEEKGQNHGNYESPILVEKNVAANWKKTHLENIKENDNRSK